MPELRNAPQTTVSNKVSKLFRFANESLEKLSDDVKQLLYSDNDDIRAYVVNSGLLSEFNLRTDFVSDANLLTMGRLFVNLMCTIDENEETERSLKEKESHKAS